MSAFDFIQRKPIPVFIWILLHFVRTKKSVDIDVHITSVCYVKILFKKIYIWKIETFNTYNGKLIKSAKLTRKG